MGSEGRPEAEPFAIPMLELDWDPAAEAELRTIEAAYATKRRSSLDGGDGNLDASCRRSKGRRLPAWGDAERIGAAGAPAPGCPTNGLWSLAPPSCRVNLKVRHPAITFGGHIVYCRTAPEVEQASMEILHKITEMKQNMDQISLGFDIEWRPVFRRGEALRKAAVMQICMDTAQCYVMHIIHSGIPPILKFILEDCSSIKVGICIANDAMKILRDYNVCVEPLEDLSGFANIKLGGGPKRWSLSSLTETLTCKELEKPGKIRMGNWEASKLSRDQLQYAATDAFVSWYLYQVLKSFPDAKSENENVEIQCGAVAPTGATDPFIS